MRERACLLAALTVLSGASAASAAIYSSEPYALGGDRSYVQTNAPVRYQYAVDSFFDITYRIDFASHPHTPPPPGTSQSFDFGSGNAETRVSLNGLPPGEPVIRAFQSSFFDVFVDLSPDGRTETFDTEMLALNLTSSSPIGPFMIRESPTRASTGRYSITTLGSGQFYIDSFFDIFTELSVDGGQTWIPGSHAGHVSILPAPSSLALLGLGGLGAFSRRRRT